MLVRGEVRHIQGYGIFVELDQGVTAFVPISEIPGATWDTLGEALAIGDFVEARVKDIDEERRQITLSIQEHVNFLREFRQKARDKIEQERQLVESLAGKTPPSRSQHGVSLQGGSGRIRHILIVDDDNLFLDSCSKWLRKLGYDVDTVEQGREGIELATTRGYDLVMLDSDLPGTTGIEVARQIAGIRKDIAVAILTGGYPLGLESDLQHLGEVDVVSKYDGIPAIGELIARLESKEHLPNSASDFQTFGQEATLIQNAAEAEARAVGLQDVLNQMLRDLLEATKAQAGIIFEMDADTGSISVVAQVSEATELDTDLSDLKYSPIRDVIRDGRAILDNHVLVSASRYTYLLRLLMFESCIGLRIEGPLPQIARHALFLFHRDADQFSPADFQKALLVSKMMALGIERHVMKAALEEMHAFIVVGQLQSGLLHEINNQLNDIELSARNVQADHKVLVQNPARMVADSAFLQDMERSISHVATASQRMREIVNSYFGLLRSRELRRLDVNEIVRQAMQVVGMDARREVQIKLLLGEDIPPTIARPSHLERVLLNVLLNAVQQIRISSDKWGIVVVKTSYEPHDGEQPIKIRVIDSGPGIHRKDFERIFERGFSTRKDGAGLGLFITRGLVEAMRGHIRIEDSVIVLPGNICVIRENQAAWAALGKPSRRNASAADISRTPRSVTR